MKNPTIGIAAKSLSEFNELKRTQKSISELNNTLISFGAAPVLFMYPTVSLHSLKEEELDLQGKEYVYKCLESVDGVVIPGGDMGFNNYDIEIVKKCIENDIPILGICAGMQTMAVATSGKVRKMPENDIHNTKKLHAHEVRIEEKTYLQDIFDANEIEVNSRHFDIVVDPGLYKVSAMYDKKIEAIEYPKNKFNIGVQWHPEELYQEKKEMALLFADFIIACENYKNEKKTKKD
jgi:gamma-glutamyl-gamma-aminobutyrate hydrolase PuuD